MGGDTVDRVNRRSDRALLISFFAAIILLVVVTAVVIHEFAGDSTDDDSSGSASVASDSLQSTSDDTEAGDSFCSDTGWLHSAGRLYEQTYRGISQDIQEKNITAGMEYGGSLRTNYNYYVQRGLIPDGVEDELTRVFLAMSVAHNDGISVTQWAQDTISSCR